MSGTGSHFVVFYLPNRKIYSDRSVGKSRGYIGGVSAPSHSYESSTPQATYSMCPEPFRGANGTAHPPGVP